jgi:hypothetical protein
MYGRAPRLPINLVFPIPEGGGGTHHQYVEDRLANLQDVYQRMREVQRCVVRRTARNYNPRGAQRLEVGSRVWYFVPRVWGPGVRKLRSSWGGPYLITRKIAPALFLIQKEAGGPEVVVGSDSLRIYHESRTGEPDERPGVRLDDGGDEFNEMLGAHEEDEEGDGIGGARGGGGAGDRITAPGAWDLDQALERRLLAAEARRVWGVRPAPERERPAGVREPTPRVTRGQQTRPLTTAAAQQTRPQTTAAAQQTQLAPAQGEARPTERSASPARPAEGDAPPSMQVEEPAFPARIERAARGE